MVFVLESVLGNERHHRGHQLLGRRQAEGIIGYELSPIVVEMVVRLSPILKLIRFREIAFIDNVETKVYKPGQGVNCSERLVEL